MLHDPERALRELPAVTSDSLYAIFPWRNLSGKDRLIEGLLSLLRNGPSFQRRKGLGEAPPDPRAESSPDNPGHIFVELPG